MGIMESNRGYRGHPGVLLLFLRWERHAWGGYRRRAVAHSTKQDLLLLWGRLRYNRPPSVVTDSDHATTLLARMDKDAGVDRVVHLSAATRLQRRGACCENEGASVGHGRRVAVHSLSKITGRIYPTRYSPTLYRALKSPPSYNAHIMPGDTS